MDSLGYGAALLDPAVDPLLHDGLGPLDFVDTAVTGLLDDGIQQQIDNNAHDLDPVDWAAFPPIDDPTYAGLANEASFDLDNLYRDESAFPSFLEPLPDEDNTIYTTTNDGFELLTASVTQESISSLAQDSTTTSKAPARTRAPRKRRLSNGYPCADCPAIHNTAGELTKHVLRRHTPREQWPFGCELCGQRWYDKRDYKRHMEVERKRAALALESLVSDDQETAGSVDTIPLRQAEEPERILTIVDRSPTQVSRSQDRLNSPRRVNTLSPILATITTTLPAPSSPIRGHYNSVSTHASAAQVLAAASGDLQRFASLPGAIITIKAVVPLSTNQQQETMTLSATHSIQQCVHQGGPSQKPRLMDVDADVDIDSDVDVDSDRTGTAVMASPAPRTSPPTRTTSRVYWAIGLLSSSTSSTSGSTSTTIADLLPTRTTSSVPIIRSQSVSMQILDIRNPRPRIRRRSTSPDVAQVPCGLKVLREQWKRGKGLEMIGGRVGSVC